MSDIERILIVDDDAGGRYIKTHILRRGGFTVSEAATGQNALDLVKKDAFALVILDVKLPDMSGLEVCAQIKTYNPMILVLQTSAAFTGGSDRAAGLSGGADSYLVEPIDPVELRATVEALLRRRRAENDLRQEHAALTQQVAAREEVVADIDARLQKEISQRTEAEEALRHAQRLDVLGQLTGGIAHDFNNVLAIVLGNLESLRRQLEKPSPDAAKMKTLTEQALYGAKRALGVTRQLLAFSRRQSLAPSVVDLNEIVRSLSALLRQTLGEKVEIKIILASDLWPVNVDPAQLETSILNLCLNARDAMPEGGSLSFETRNISSEGEDLVVLIVGDTGIGMSEHVARQAFEPFFTTKDVGYGTGLGLSQVHGFVTQSGGRVHLDSKVGHGTKVMLHLPRYAGEIPRVADAEAPIETASREACILVVEDDAPVRLHAVGILREMGYRVLDASNGREALALLDEHPEIEVLFSDVGLPGGISGPHLGRTAQERWPDLKVLYTTAYAPERLEAEGLTDMDGVIAKPFTYEALARRVADLLANPDTLPHILVIEDEPMIRMDLTDGLKQMGLAVTEAHSVADAWQRLRDDSGISAIVTDIGLPDGRGDEFALAVRAERPRLPVVIATGYGDTRLREKFNGDRHTVVISKPYYADQIAAALRKMGMNWHDTAA